MVELRYPEDMNELVYFTRRVMGEGKVMAWVFKEDCPVCGKAKMGKPVEGGKVKIRATEYLCPECGHCVPKGEYEETLTANIDYVCPKCKNAGKIQIPYKRKSFQGVKALVFECEKCGEKIPITKKMKEPKKKGEPSIDEE